MSRFTLQRYHAGDGGCGPVECNKAAVSVFCTRMARAAKVYLAYTLPYVSTTGYDAIVAGLGGMGSAAAAHLSKRHKRVLGLDRFALSHELGSSAGQSRIIRKAYFEGPSYVPLLVRAYDLWRELERETSAQLLDLVGVLIAGRADGAILEAVRRTTTQHGIRVDEVSHRDFESRFPQARLLHGEIALLEPDAGIVFPERGIAAHQRSALAHGAELRGNTTVVRWWRSAAGTLHVELSSGETVEADRLALCAGPWLDDVAPELHLPLCVQRNVQVWFTPQSVAFARGALPVFFLDRAGLPMPLYGFPDLGDGVKAAFHAYGDVTTPAALDRDIHAQDVNTLQAALNAFLPGAAAEYRSGKACMYTLTPDRHFIVDRHPNDAGVVIAGGFSGHGYKFCPIIGEIVADLLDGKRRHDIAFLSLERFASTPRAAHELA